GAAGDISSGLIVNANGHGGEVDALVGWGEGVLNPTVTFGANYFSHNTELQFNPGVQAVAADVYAWFGNPGTTVFVYDTGGNLLGSTSIPGTFGGNFFGVRSDGALIGSVLFDDTVSDTSFLDDVAFGGGGGGRPLAVLCAPSAADDPAYRAAIAAALGAGATVDYFVAPLGTPSVADLQAYDAVYTWANFAYADPVAFGDNLAAYVRSEEHTSELQSRENLVCRLLLEKNNK